MMKYGHEAKRRISEEKPDVEMAAKEEFQERTDFGSPTSPADQPTSPAEVPPDEDKQKQSNCQRQIGRAHV